MIFELLEFVSVMGERGSEIFQCKFCYGEDDETGWLRPCKCSGTLKWVHKTCFELWMRKAPAEQQNKCQTCKYVYDKQWVLKPLRDWRLPVIKPRAIVVLEIFLDAYSTFKFIRGFFLFWKGQRSIWMQMVHFLFWRLFIATSRRCSYYKSLLYTGMASIFEIKVKDFDPTQAEKSEDLFDSSADAAPVNPRPMILAHIPVDPDLPFPHLPGL